MRSFILVLCFILTGWKTECLPTTRMGAAAVVRTVMFTDAGEYARGDTFYDDATCQTTGFYFEETGTWKRIGDELVIGMKTQSLMVATETAAQALDSMNFCGQDVWTTSGLTDITDMGCTRYPTNDAGEFLEFYVKRDNQMLLGNWWRIDAVLTGLSDPHYLDEATPFIF